MGLTGPVEILRRRVADEPARPLVTFYDDATGERVELSARTFDNWVAKTANLLVDGLDAEPGDRVVLALPHHWQTAVWLYACWSAGLIAQPVDVSGPLDVSSVEPEGSSGPYILAASEEVLQHVSGSPSAREIVGLSLHALGGPLGDRPAGVVDYAVEVRGYGDRFVPFEAVSPDAPALSVMRTTMTGAEVARRAAQDAATWGLDARSRVLVDMSFATFEGLSAGLLAPIASGGSVIIQRNLDKMLLDRRITLEHVSAVAGVAGWDEASGSAHRLL